MSKLIKIQNTPDLSQPITAKLLGQVIKARRTQAKLRLEDAAALCGVAKQTLMKIEHGQETSQFGSILQICSELGVKLCIAPWDNDAGLNDDWQ